MVAKIISATHRVLRGDPDIQSQTFSSPPTFPP